MAGQLRIRTRFSMAALFASFLILASAPFVAQAAAGGQILPHTQELIRTAENPPAAPALDFSVKSDCKGCISWGDYSAAADFPKVNGKTATKIRLYYSDVSFQTVTEASPYVELPLLTDPSGVILVPDVKLGNIPSGRKFYFKAGLADANDAIIWMSTDQDVNETKHTATTK